MATHHAQSPVSAEPFRALGELQLQPPSLADIPRASPSVQGGPPAASPPSVWVPRLRFAVDEWPASYRGCCFRAWLHVDTNKVQEDTSLSAFLELVINLQGTRQTATKKNQVPGFALIRRDAAHTSPRHG